MPRFKCCRTAKIGSRFQPKEGDKRMRHLTAFVQAQNRGVKNEIKTTQVSFRACIKAGNYSEKRKKKKQVRRGK